MLLECMGTCIDQKPEKEFCVKLKRWLSWTILILYDITRHGRSAHPLDLLTDRWPLIQMIRKYLLPACLLVCLSVCLYVHNIVLQLLGIILKIQSLTEKVCVHVRACVCVCVRARACVVRLSLCITVSCLPACSLSVHISVRRHHIS